MHVEEDRRIPSLMEGIHIRNQQIFELEQQLGDVVDKYHFNEEDNFRLRKLINDMQYHYEAAVKVRDMEIQQMDLRLLYLEEELFNLQSKNPFNKTTVDPERLVDLERALALKDEEFNNLRRKYKLLKEKADVLLSQADSRERSRILAEADTKNLPFVLENDDLKKQLAEARRQLELANKSMNEIKSESQETKAENDRFQRKIKEYEMQDKFRKEKEEDYKRSMEPIYIKVSEDQNLLDGIMSLTHYVRESICDLIMEIFIKSANQAHTKKVSSMTIFTISVKEMKERNIRGLVIVLYLYRKMKQFIKLYFPYYGKIGLTDEMEKMTMGRKKRSEPCEFRDDTNKWLEQNIALVMQQFKTNKKKDPNKIYFHLYRLLALRYRVKYPTNNEKQPRVDVDIRVRMENKISMALIKLLLDVS